MTGRMEPTHGCHELDKVSGLVNQLPFRSLWHSNIAMEHGITWPFPMTQLNM